MLGKQEGGVNEKNKTEASYPDHKNYIDKLKKGNYKSNSELY
jgi:hypothetical protein